MERVGHLLNCFLKRSMSVAHLVEILHEAADEMKTPSIGARKWGKKQTDLAWICIQLGSWKLLMHFTRQAYSQAHLISKDAKDPPT